jgi:hypothetical protein
MPEPTVKCNVAGYYTTDAETIDAAKEAFRRSEFSDVADVELCTIKRSLYGTCWDIYPPGHQFAEVTHA